jgi:hypothetical protein
MVVISTNVTDAPSVLWCLYGRKKSHISLKAVPLQFFPRDSRDRLLCTILSFRLEKRNFMVKWLLSRSQEHSTILAYVTNIHHKCLHTLSQITKTQHIFKYIHIQFIRNKFMSISCVSGQLIKYLRNANRFIN